MSTEQITAMIVEDDEIASKIVEQFAQRNSFRVIATASTGQQALDLLEVFTPQIVLLDVYLPDMSGIELLWNIRRKHRGVDIILITAANDADTVSEAIRGGVFGYLIKPIMIDRFNDMLQRYTTVRKQLRTGLLMEQTEVDRLFIPGDKSTGSKRDTTLLTVTPLAATTGGASSSSFLAATMLPKGIDKLTLKRLRDHLNHTRDAVSADELAALAGMSHSTVRRYLEFMVSQQELEIDIIYGTVGRPERKYKRLLP
ncbi:response regulator [Paenibacillus sp. 481]|uniref:response regulator n=1 Tax=Paenibacillus sp. 481 TaxID=2835869 RepID=UPI001E3603CF|nr:response regulator [Paenibacillus sp. 481]UHA75090.1 response regulator [Paenibacillus sp. 481]